MQPKLTVDLPSWPPALWVRTLQTVPLDQWSPEVQADFATCINAEPHQWAWDHSMLWGGKPSQTPPKLVEAVDHIVTVQIDVTAPDKLIQERIASFVGAVREDIGHVPLKGRPKHQPRQSKYSFPSPPDADAWQACLSALELRTALPNEPLWKIGLALAKEHPIAKNLLLMDDGPDRRKELASMASRYLKKAHQLQTNVAKGKGP